METSPMPAATMATRQYFTLLFLFLTSFNANYTVSAYNTCAKAFLSVEIMAWLPLLLLVFYFHKIGTQYF